MTGLFVLLLSPVFWMWEGFVFVRLWYWFVVPLGLPVVDMAQAVGLAALVGLVTTQRQRQDEDLDSEWLTKVTVHALGVPAVCLLVGSIASVFMP